MRWMLVLCGALVLGLSGCTLLQGQLSIDQAVARLVPNDPQNVSNPDHFIGELEMLKATQMWIDGKPVPGTGGQTISEAVIKQLVLLWTQQAPIP